MGTFLDKSLLLGIFTKNFFAKQLFTKQQNNNFYWIKDDYRHLQADTDANILLFRFRGFFKNDFLHFYFGGELHTRISLLSPDQTFWWSVINFE